MAGTIGIKLANGEFYPILEENSSAKKRLILTTVHDGQESVQIDLFRSLSKSMLDAQYIGSLVVEDIKARSRGEPSVELIISSGKGGNITADAWDRDADAGSDHNILNVSLMTLDATEQDENIPDFDLEKQDQDTYTPAGLYDSGEPADKKGKKFPWGILILIILLLLIALGLLWYFFCDGKDKLPSIIESVSNRFTTTTEQPVSSPPPVAATEPPPPPVEPPAPPPAAPVEPPAPPPVVETPPPVEPPPPVAAPPPPAEPPVIQAPVAPPPARTQVTPRNRPPAPVSSYKVPAVIPANGAPYTLRWGDTLWDISEAFYRNPWLYPRIARFNNISNPDRIISGRTIRIPPLR